MCTVTSIPSRGGHGLRLACNRDESPQREAARSPKLHTFGDVAALMPVDPVSDGTWIAVSDAGLIMTLLNLNPPRGSLKKHLGLTQSRGVIIPGLLHATTLDEAVTLALALEPRRFKPFRLVLLDREQAFELRSDAEKIATVNTFATNEPLFFASSGLGDHLVEEPRRNLFERWLTEADDFVEMQEAYHRHYWPDRRHISVCMERAEARTVSYTVVELNALQATMTYRPAAPDQRAETVTVTLPLRQPVRT